jgi:hypothetical protein
MHALLLALGQQPEIAAGAARYLSALAPSLYCYVAQECLKRYLMAQGVVKPAMLITIATTCASPLLYWLFMFKLDMRLQGAACALNLAQLVQALLLAAYVVHRDARLRGRPEQTFQGWSREAVRGWGKYLKYAVPAAAMVGGRGPAAANPLPLLLCLARRWGQLLADPPARPPACLPARLRCCGAAGRPCHHPHPPTVHARAHKPRRRCAPSGGCTRSSSSWPGCCPTPRLRSALWACASRCRRGCT